MKHPRPIVYPVVVTAGCILLAVGSHADTVTLKNGDVLEGTVILETADALKLEYQFSPKIRDTKTIPMAEIQKVVKTPPDLAAYEKISKLYPLPDLSEEKDYAKLVEQDFEPFLKEYPTSEKADEVTRMRDAANADMEKLQSGSLLIRGAWVSAEQRKRDADKYQAILLRYGMNANAKNFHYAEAMRDFEKYRLSFFYSEEFREVVGEAKCILGKYLNSLDQMIKEQPSLEERRKSALANENLDEDSRKTAEAIRKEVADFGALSAEEQKVAGNWPSIYRYDMKSLTEARTKAEAAMKEIQAINPTEVAAYAGIVRKALGAASVGNEQLSTELVTAAAALGADKQWLETTVKSRLLVATPEAPKGKPDATPAAKDADADAVTADLEQFKSPTQKAMEKVEKVREENIAKDATAPPKDAAVPVKGAADPAKEVEKTDQEKKSAASKLVDKARNSGAQAVQTAEQAVAAAADQVEEAADEAGGFNQILKYAAGGLAVVLLLAFLLQKRKKKDE